jgi:hypothetical protein
VQARAGNKLELTGIGNDVLVELKQLRERINKGEYIKLKVSTQQKKWPLN